MIKIREGKSVKNPGSSSLFVSFDYNPKIVETIKQLDTTWYNPDTYTWELSLNSLSFLINELTSIDDIDVEFLEDEKSKDLDLTLDYKTKPFKYQLDGIKWLISNENGLLTDVPGLGKTLQLIYAAEELKKQKGIEHCLIICGINTLKANWKKEIEKHSSLDCIIIGEKINSKGNVSYASIKERAEQLYQPIEEFFVIINVESIRDSTVIDAIKNSKNKFDMIVVDEIHRLKGATTSTQSKNLLKLAKVGKYHYGLTGTLLVNSPLDCFIPLKFINRERSTYTNFKNFYCVIDHKFGHQNIVGYKNIDILKNEISKCSLRRTKDLLDLPIKTVIPVYLDLDTNQKKFYDNLQKGVIEEADRVNIKNTSLLGLITRLRQATTCPSTLSSTVTSSTKIDRALELSQEIISNGEKVVIFSVFKDPLKSLKETLDDIALLCTGDQSDEEISKNIDKFQTEDKYKIMLCTSSKMGTGITLTAASYEIFLDSDWTPANELQAEDRCYRIGTKKALTIYKLVAIGTIDERVQALLKIKSAISDFIVDNKVSEDTKDDLKYLLGL